MGSWAGDGVQTCAGFLFFKNTKTPRQKGQAAEIAACLKTAEGENKCNCPVFSPCRRDCAQTLLFQKIGLRACAGASEFAWSDGKTAEIARSAWGSAVHV